MLVILGGVSFFSACSTLKLFTITPSSYYKINNYE